MMLKIREFVMLAQSMTPKLRRNIDPSSWFTSIKLDGQRCLWIPFTRGRPISDFSWANTARDSRPHICSGLWSRLGKPIFCPDWFVESLPKDYCLDGELWCGRGKFNQLESTVRKLQPDHDEWADVEYKLFDAPYYDVLFMDGRSGKKPNYLFEFKDVQHPSQSGSTIERFEFTYWWLRKQAEICASHVTVLEQHRFMNWGEVDAYMEQELERGGEGLIMRRMSSSWTPKRSEDMLKLKPYFDAEAEVIGWTWGEGKYEGMMGSLELKMPNGKKFFLSGFTDEERELSHSISAALPNEIIVPETPTYFKIGTVITYKYRELTPDGIPREASYLRKRSDV